MAKERQYLTAVSIIGGIITLIDLDGNIKYYRQRGIGKLTDGQRQGLIAMGLLQRNWSMFSELPSYISISFEDPESMGKARASYPGMNEIMKAMGEKRTKAVGTKASGTKISGTKGKKK